MPNRARGRLSAPPDAQEIFTHALGVYASGQYLIKGAVEKQRREFLVSAIILVPFSCELLLKCLLCLEGARGFDIHFLDTLFHKLNRNTQSRIKALWDERAKPKVMKFAAQIAATKPEGGGPVFHFELEDALRANRNLFERARYWYEFEPGGNALGELVPELVKVILESKPEWKSVASAYGYSEPLGR